MTHAASINRISQISRPETAHPRGTTHAHWRWAAPSQHGTPDMDAVELSPHALWMQQLATLPPGRIDVVNQVRAQIGAGTYENDFKIEVALERLAADVT